MKETPTGRIIRLRRSTRKFKPGVITRRTLQRIVRAGIHAPSGANSQNVRFVVVTSKKQLGLLSKRANFIRNGSAAILVFTEPTLKFPKGEEELWSFLAPQNAAAAIQNMCLLATELKLGSCWVSCSEEMNDTRVLSGGLWPDMLDGTTRDKWMFDEWSIRGLLVLGHPSETDSEGYPKGDESHNHNPVARKVTARYASGPRTHLAITGSFGGGDLGDDEMLAEHLRRLDGMGFPREDILLAGHNSAYTSWYHNHPLEKCTPSKRFPTEEEANWADALLVTGGGTINTRNGTDADKGGKSLKRMHGLVMPFVKAGKPVFMSGQTIGPLGIDPEHDALAKELIEAVDVLTVRDTGLSREFIEKIGAVPKKLIETTDDAAGCPCAKELPEDVEKFFASREAVFAFNTTTYTSDTPEKLDAATKICQGLLDWGGAVVLVPHHPVDYKPLGIIRDRLKSPNVLYVNTKEWRAPQVKAVLFRCAGAIGGRYHFFVFAAGLGVPVIGLAGNEYSRIKQMGASHSSVDVTVVYPPGAITNWRRVLKDALLFHLPCNCRPSGPVIAGSKSFAAFEEWLAEVESR